MKNETNEQQETTGNCFQLIRNTSEGEQLRTLADAFALMLRPSGDYCELPGRLRDIAAKCDLTASKATDAAHLAKRTLELQSELHELRSLENRDIAKLNVVAEKLQVTPGPHWKQTLHDALNRLIVSLEDGTLAYDETNSIVSKAPKPLSPVFDEIAAERGRQAARFSADHDDRHVMDDWATIMQRLLLKHRADPRIAFIKIAATCVAAIEAIDRQAAKGKEQ